ncbi:MAG: isoleucyl-tRNA synthetase, partial [Solirubrobacteraceae bacterium]|nr:isoleucyl-tRNA synthetase [Solirubrobacteraceae bacterium]
DPSVYVRFPVAQDGGPLQAGDELLVWTTTPWTLVSNAAVAVDPELIYVRAKTGRLDPPVVLAEALVERVLGDPAGVQILARFPGAAIDGVRYDPPFHYLGADEYGERGHSVLLADFVTADDGTGLVHTAIAFGEEDFRLGAQYGLKVVNPVRLDGTYDERIGAYAGRYVKDADPDLIEDLRRRGRLLRSEPYLHSYPHCWRCGTPLLYYAKPSWYIATSKIRDELLEANEQVDWHPEHIKHGRFGKWLENNVDWALSRERYWGTPLPVWRCAQGHVTVVGGFDDLERRSGVRLEDPHRPYCDEVTFPCDECGETATRVPEVIDVWFDSGAMPFAQRHEPFASGGDRTVLDELYPADFICEALDQTRGWFYSLLAVSTLLRGPQVPYRSVVCLGLILDGEGQKMSKSKGNVVGPTEVIDRFGADALRWYFFTSKQPWDGYLFSPDAIGEGVRLFLRQLWNTYAFATLYPVDASRAAEPPNDLDRWIRSRLGATIATVTERLDDYDATNGGRAIAEFVDDLSNWYVRRSRRRFWDGDPAAHETLRHCLVTVSKLLAPYVPFVADEIYDNLDGSEASVHLCDWPQAEPRDEELETAMATARETVRLGLAARGGAKLKVRQPLHEAVVVAAGRERAAIERLADVVREELNVKVLRFVSEAGELGSYTLKPNYRTLGPRFGKAMPQVADAVAALDPAHVADALRAGHEVGVFIDGHDHELGPDDLLLAMAPLDGYQLEREGSHAVALELKLDDELRREGLAREVVHAVQTARRDAGLEISDRIVLTLGGDDELLDAAREHEGYLSGEVLAVQVRYAANGSGEVASIEGRELRISVARAAA